jgi:hypothetical protein
MYLITNWPDEVNKYGSKSKGILVTAGKTKSFRKNLYFL